MAEADRSIFAALPPVREVAVADAAALDAALRAADAPFIVRGLVADWPLVAAGRESGRAARDYLSACARDRAFAVSVGTGGDRLFYDDAMGMNFRMMSARLPEIFARMDEGEGRADAPTIYLGSVDIHDYFDGLHAANHVDLGERACLASIWIGTRTRIAAHNDVPHNLACVAVGRRRFTLFPRDQFANLYLGPIDNTPAGRAVSMIDFHAPDFDRFPRFADALAVGQVADLAAGDALYVPAMWWHHVEALDAFNVLVNYWWRETPRWLGHPQDALNHALLAIRDLPADEREHWRALFDHYVFGDAEAAAAHLPPDGRGVLAPLTPETAGRLRAYLLRQLSR
ncbi:cupin-like domain-containing protein [Sphingomonas sp.]|uniref:cupin-like domain-containing protein n=1 Tax=Sphingomonas sp. TaxID=28214 RepID=UPI002C859B9B|nr:cupin-like domain-containing protein [Sphingomonas sp.]HTG39489.1 cupin-like domain-containing protein [Sphingomonas sp.]